MPVEYGDFLTSAAVIIDKDDCSEIDYRNAISRAYYSAYHACKPLISVGEYKGKGAHAKLIASMLDNDSHKIKTLGKMLENIKKKRAMADYELDFLVRRQDAKKAIADAKSLHRYLG